ncbi:MAG: efflux RND transporter permease subunit, partial [Myxococcota bacterium]
PEIARAIREATVELPAGGVRTEGGEILLRTDARREVGRDFEDIVLRGGANGAALRVSDVATVRDGFEEAQAETTFFGKRAVRLDVYRTGAESPVGVATEVRRWLGEAEGTFPPGIEAAVWNDESEDFASRVDLLRRNGLLGLVLVLVVLGIFLEPALAFWVTLGIPISFAGALLFIPLGDISINMISLFGFIVTLGIVVDDAIVVGEAVHARRTEGLGLRAAAIRGARDIAAPVTISVVTTCMAFAPMLFVPGVMGKFFRNVPVVVICVLLVSLVEALFVLPAHLSHPLPRWLRVAIAPLGLLRRLRGEAGLAWIAERLYRPALGSALRHRDVTLALGLAALVASVGLVHGRRIGTSDFPRIEGDVVLATLRMPVGTAYEETRRAHERLTEAAERALAPHGGQDIVRGLLTDVGWAWGQGYRESRGSHLATARLYLVDADARAVGAREVAELWREAAGGIAGAEAVTFNAAIFGEGGARVEVRLRHPSRATLEDAAERLAAELRTYAGLRDVDSGVSPGKEQLDLRLSDEGRARGLTVAELARQLRDAYYGAEALRQQRGREELRVLVRRPLAERVSLADVEELIVRTPEGGEMRLGQAAHIARGRAYTQLRRVDGRRSLSVTAGVVSGVANADAMLARLQAGPLPELAAAVPGLSFAVGGEQEEVAESIDGLYAGFGFALFAIYGLLAIALGSYVQPLLVMSTIPLGLVGALLGHWALGYDLSIISTMGIVALSGVLVNDSLLLMRSTNAVRRAGASADDAIRAGSLRRFRPIVLTSLTTFFGLAPMIAETSVQARFLVPMALSLGVGILFATFVMLLFVPAAYLAVEDARRWFGGG